MIENQNNSYLAWALVSLCERSKRPIDRELLRQQLLRLHDLVDLQLAAKALGLDLTFKCVSAEELHHSPLPAVAVINGATQHGQQLCLLLRATEERIVYLRSDSPIPVMTSVAEFSGYFKGEIIVAMPKVKAPVLPQDYRDRWEFTRDRFVQEIQKLSQPQRDYHLASLAIRAVVVNAQLMALTAVCDIMDAASEEPLS